MNKNFRTDSNLWEDHSKSYDKALQDSFFSMVNTLDNDEMNNDLKACCVDSLRRYYDDDGYSNTFRISKNSEDLKPEGFNDVIHSIIDILNAKQDQC